jgi:hypothetical protein
MTITFINIPAQEWQSSMVYYGSDNKLVYERDSFRNCIPDFSYAGYKNSNDTIPYVPVVKTISPVAGDNTNHINNALIEVAFNPINEDGFRGALLLTAGTYEVSGILYMKFSGVIIRGVGDGADPGSNTIIYGTGNSPQQRTILIAGGGSNSKWKEKVSGTQTNIVSDTVLIGERSFEVEDASTYSVGDNIIIYHPCTEEWLAAIDYGGTHSDDLGAEPGVDVPWEVDSQPILFNRYITDISGNRITVDAPVFNHLVKSLSQSYIYKYTRQGIVTNLGIENLRIDIETSGNPADEDHAWDAVELIQVEDSWVRDCTFLHFGLSGVETSTATRITVENCKALEPVSIITGGRRYNFNTYTASQQILFKDCHASEGRHSYVSNGMSWTSGVVFYNCTSEGAYAASEGHRRWSMGFLWDNHRELDDARGGYNSRRLGLYNRGYYGTSHGWGIAHSVAWNCDVRTGQIIVQQPPTAQNYAIGCFASLVACYGESSFNEPAGYIEGTDQAGLNPQSLFLAQLSERLDPTVSVDEQTADIIPSEFQVYQNYPNPFNPSTTLSYTIPEIGNVKVEVYDVTGKKIKTLFNGVQEAGYNYIRWNGDNDFNSPVGSGLYFYTVQTLHGILSSKMILIK